MSASAETATRPHAHDLSAHLQPRPLPAELLQALQQRFGDQLATSLALREQHGRDESVYNVPPPDAVLFAESTDDVADVLKLATHYRVPVIPFGAGSSLEGHLLAVQGGISLDVNRMNQIVSVNADDLTVTVQPGVTRKQLNEALRHEMLTQPREYAKKQG